jgi:hypothetical protein
MLATCSDALAGAHAYGRNRRTLEFSVQIFLRALSLLNTLAHVGDGTLT